MTVDLRELLAARSGLPTESLAARKIALFAVIPAAISGLALGTQLVALTDPIARLVGICAVTTLGCGFAAAYLVLGVYALFGFRPVAVLADALVGGFWGLLLGGTLTLIVMTLQLVPLGQAMWPLIMVPIGAVSVPLVRTLRGRVH